MSPGWQLRPATADDLAAIVEIIRAETLRHVGPSDIDLTQVREQIAADPHFDFARDQVVVEADGQLIAAAVINPRTTNITVHPDHERPGLRGELLAWTERRQVELGRVPFRAGVAGAHSVAKAVLAAAGYRLERFYADMIRTFATSGPPEPGEVPVGYAMRPLDRVRDLNGLHVLDDRAFCEQPDYLPESLAEFEGRHLLVSDFAPAWSLVVETAAGQLVGSLIGKLPVQRPHGHVAVLAVDPAHRRRGIGRALLLAAFGAIHAAGLATAELDVASDNPRALDLYTGVGMVEGARFEHHVRTP